MALSSVDSGTKTTDGTEQTLTTNTSGGVFTLALDTANMVNGDEILVKIKTKILSGDTSQIAYAVPYKHAQTGAPNKYSIPVPADIEFVATIQRIAGSDRAYKWSVLKY